MITAVHLSIEITYVTSFFRASISHFFKR